MALTQRVQDEQARQTQAGWLAAIGREKDRRAFADLFRHFAPRIKSYLRQLGCDEALAEELAQEAMLTVWRKAALFDPARSAPATWVFAIARNLRIDRLRRERWFEPDAGDPLLIPDDAPAADQELARHQSGQRLDQALSQLSPDQIQVIQMSFYNDQPHAQIASKLGIPLGTVKSRLRLAMTRLRAILGDEVR